MVQPFVYSLASLITINTSNPGKLAEYQDYFAGFELTTTKRDLPEPKADALTVIQYKASQFDGVLVDDVSLEVEGEDVGINIRWLLAKLRAGAYVGKRAVYRCFLGVRRGSLVYIYQGEVRGQIVAPRGDGFGFGPAFLPDGAEKTLGEDMARAFNARYLAVMNFREGRPLRILPPLEVWQGAFQTE